MQVGIDVGATKIESVVLEENGQERHRSRTECPKDYLTIINVCQKIIRIKTFRTKVSVLKFYLFY